MVYNMKSKISYISQLWKNIIHLKNSKKCIIILREINGRLGNNLFQFAVAYGLSLNRSCQLYISSHFIARLSDSFDINLRNLAPESRLSSYSNSTEIINTHCTFYPHLLNPNNNYSLELSGFWQVCRYFIDYQKQIKQQLRFKELTLNHVNEFLNRSINRHNSTLVGIHIRRGDFLLIHRPVSSDKYIFNAMSYFQLKYRLVTFLIVSDDKLYCQKLFNRTNNVLITPKSFAAIEDLAILTMCDHLILTVGTFGWWAGFLLNNKVGEIIIDSKPDHSPLDVNCRQEDYFPPWFSFLNKTN
ncbi:unnamed protein product [Adineta ricciae]|uniref:L-Fucosyltransferase n=2 Tax=Adineta ricciae TaxID=249248 RepID=A0A815N5B4_ADIRI|nr:unnamed protein product [Adineta ricciae]